MRYRRRWLRALRVVLEVWPTGAGAGAYAGLTFVGWRFMNLSTSVAQFVVASSVTGIGFAGMLTCIFYMCDALLSAILV